MTKITSAKYQVIEQPIEIQRKPSKIIILVCEKIVY